MQLTAPKKGIFLKGRMEAILYDRFGNIIDKREKFNLITTVGFDFIADAIGKPSGRPNVMSHIAVGTGTTAANVGDTTLQTEVAREAATYSHTSSSDEFEFEATFNAGTATGALTEAGVLNAASSGTLLDRLVFSAVNKGASDILVQRFIFTMA